MGKWNLPSTQHSEAFLLHELAKSKMRAGNRSLLLPYELEVIKEWEAEDGFIIATDLGSDTGDDDAMADQIVAKNTSEGSFTPHPEGQFAARCVDTISLGDKLATFPGAPPKLYPKCVIVFRTGEKNEKGEVVDIGKEFTISMFELASLRQALEQWRGKSYTETQVAEGVPLHKLVGQPALITVEHKQSAKGRTYANIKSITPLPKQMAASAPETDGYKRPDFYAERAKAYAQEAATFLKSVAPRQTDDFEDFPQTDHEDDDLPF